MLVLLEDHPADIGRLKICSSCSGVYGPWSQVEDGRNGAKEAEYVQLCDCGKPIGSRDAVSSQPPWPRFDFNEYATICYCCGLVGIPSGSKWSVWFCSWCKGQVWKLNERHGAAVVPIGRHSLMNGVFLRPATPEPEHEEVDQFLVELKGLSGRGGVLREWSRSVIKKNIAFVDPHGADPLLNHYVAVVQWYAESNVDWSNARGWCLSANPKLSRRCGSSFARASKEVPRLRPLSQGRAVGRTPSPGQSLSEVPQGKHQPKDELKGERSPLHEISRGSSPGRA